MGLKSATRPDETVLAYCKAISEYTPVEWLADKKSPEAYLNRSMNSSNYSPIDLIVQQTNKLFAQSQLVARPIIEFLPLFQEVSFTQKHETKAKEITETYNQLIKQALFLEQSVKTQSGPSLIAVSTTSGKQIKVENLLKFDPADSPVWTQSKLDIKLFPNSKNSLPHKLMAVVVTDQAGNSCYRPIGTVSEESIKEHNLQAGMRLTAVCSLTPGATATQVKAKFKEAAQYLEKVQQDTLQPEHLPIAAALWHANHTRSDQPHNLKKASVAFNAFPDSVINQLSRLQFTNLTVVGLHQPTNEHLDKRWNGEKVQCAIAVDTAQTSPNYGKRIVAVEGRKLAPISHESPTLPPGTQFEAEIVAPPGAAVIATTLKGNSLKITQVKNYDFANQELNKEAAQIRIDFIPNRNTSKSPLLGVLLENKALGILDKESAAKLESVNLLKSGVTLTVNLHTAPATVAYLKVNPDSVVYPHQKVAPSPSQTPAQDNASRWANRELEPVYWLAVATAIGQSPKYVDRVKQVIEAYKTGTSLSERAEIAMQKDFQAYKQVSQELGQWHQAAKALDKPEAYLKKVEEAAVAFHSAATPLSQQATNTMQRDLQDYQQLTVKPSNTSPVLLANDPVQVWQHYSQQVKADAPFIQAREIAIAALRDGVEPDDVHQILAASPKLQKFDAEALQRSIKSIVSNAELAISNSVSQQQFIKQRGSQTKLSL